MEVAALGFRVGTLFVLNRYESDMKKLMDAILSILAVLVGVFGVVGLLNFSLLGGAVFLVAAAMLFPPVGRKIAKLSGRPWLSPVVGLLLAFLIGPVAVALTAPSAEEVAAREERNAAEVEAMRIANAEKAAVAERRRAEEASRRADAEKEQRKRNPEYQWQYQEYEDEMTGKTTKTAFMVSQNSLSLGFPYNGKNHGNIHVRRHPSYGVDVIIRVEKGQILCRSYENCSIQIRFDEEQPSFFPAVGSADNDSTVIFLKNNPRFIESAKKAKKILVQVPMYKEGNQVLRFETMESLVWGAK
ncbi:hypothetical protein ACI0FW_00633 [Alcaligenes nematophilus]